jgi:hypothetical protein
VERSKDAADRHRNCTGHLAAFTPSFAADGDRPGITVFGVTEALRVPTVSCDWPAASRRADCR